MADSEYKIKVTASDDGAAAAIKDIIDSFTNVKDAVEKVVTKLLEANDTIKKLQEEVRAFGREMDAAALSVEHQADALDLANLKLEDQISKLQGGPANNRLAEALLESAMKADALAASLQGALEKERELLEHKSVGFWQSLFTGQAETKDLKDKFQPYLDQLEEVEGQKRLKLAQFDRENADVLKNGTEAQIKDWKTRRDQTTKSFEDQATTILNGLKTVREAEQTALDTKKAGEVADLKQGGASLDADNLSVTEAMEEGKAVEQTNQKYRTRKGLITDLELTEENYRRTQVSARENEDLAVKRAVEQNRVEAEDRRKFTEDRVKQLETEAASIANKAAVERSSIAVTIDQTAAAQASKTITDIDNQARSKRLPLLTQEQKLRIQAAQAEKDFSSAANEATSSMAKEVIKTQEQSDKVRDMSAAYAEGGAAIQAAQEKAQLAPFQRKVDDLQAAFDRLKGKPGVSAAQIAAMGAALKQAKAELDAVKKSLGDYNAESHKSDSNKLVTDLDRQIVSVDGYSVALVQGTEAVRRFNVEQKVDEYKRNSSFDQSAAAVDNYRQKVDELSRAEQKSNTNKLTQDLALQIKSVQGYASAVLQGTSAVRSFNIEQKVLEYQKNPALDQSAKAVGEYRRQLALLTQEQQLQAAAEKVASFEKYKDYTQELQDLNAIRAAVIARGQSTMAVDAAIRETLQAQIKGYNDLLLKTNSLKNGFKAFFSEYVHDGTTAAQKVHDVMKQAMDGISNNLSQMIVTGKADWASLAESVIESITQMAVQWVLQHTIMAAMNKVFGEQEMIGVGSKNAATITSASFVAGANAYAANAAFPPIAAAAAAAAQGIVQGMAAGAITAAAVGGAKSAEGGQWLVPGPQLTMLHAQEMVLPAGIASRMRDVVEGRGGVAGGGLTVVVNHSVNAVDAESFQRVVRRHGNLIGNEVARALKKKGLATR